MHLTNGSPPAATDRHLLRYGTLAAGCAGLFAVLLTVVEVRWAPLAGLDRGWTDSEHAYARGHAAWTAAVQTLSNIGGTVTMRTLLGLAAVWLWLIGARVLACWAAAQALVGWAALRVLEVAVDRPRPHFTDPVAHASGPGFPAGHAMASAITCVILLWLVRPHANRAGRAVAAGAAAVTVLAVGWTRIVLGLHWPSDILAGWLAAGVVLGAVTVAVEIWRPGDLARDVRRVNWRTRPRVQRVLVGEPSAPGRDG
ncbi:phosphatase PAP2 family protein [Kitasatospora sp. NPDC057015]|uniref:phosphatase PAP2 family protein n=1 Tax=Kitasatospora sp. NPDC057015 TaxID=3346001 RepID=UPI0036433571